MTSQETMNFAIMLAASLLLLAEGLVAVHRFRFAGGPALAIALFVGAAEAFCYALVFHVAEGPTMVRLAAIYAVTGPPLATFWFIFAARFAGARSLGRRWLAVTLLSAAGALLVVTALDPALIYPSPHDLTALSFSHISVEDTGALFTVQLAWFYALVVGGLVLLLIEALRAWHFCRRQAAAVIAGAGAIFVCDIAFMAGYEPVRGLHLGLAVVAAGMLPLIWALPRLRAADLFAVWQPHILESMTDAVLVADGEGRIVSANRSAQRLLAAGRDDGRSAERLDDCEWLAGLAADPQAADPQAAEPQAADQPPAGPLGDEIGRTLTVQLEGRTRHLDMRQSSLRDGRGRELSRVLVLRDLTEHVEATAAARDAARQQNMLLDRLDEANQDLRTLVDAGLEFGASLKPENVLGAVARRMRELTGASRCSLYRFDGESMTALFTAEGETVSEDCAEFSFSVASCPSTRQAVTSRLPVAVVDTTTDPGISDVERADAVRLGYRASLDLPLVNGGKVVGLVVLVDTQPREFEHVELLRGLAPIAAQALVNSQVYAEQRETARRLSLVSDAGTLFSSSLAVDDVLLSTCRRLTDITEAPICSIYVVEEGALRCRASVYDGEVDRQWMAQEFSPEQWPATTLALATGKLVVVRNLSDPLLSEAQRVWMQRRGERSVLVVPLVVAGEAFGTVALIDRRERAYETEELRTVEAVCGAAALAIRNADMFNRESNHVARLASLLEASRATTSTVVLEDVLPIVAESSCKAVDAQECVIWEYREDEGVLAERSYFSSRQTHYTPNDSVRLDKNPAFRRILAGGVVVEETISGADLQPLTRAVMEEWHEKTRLSAPLVFDGRPIGMLVLIETEHERHFRPDEISLVQALADQAAVAIQNARHYEQLERATARLESQLELSRVLLELSGGLIAAHDPQEVFARIAALVKRVVDNDCLEIRLIDAETDELYCAYASDAAPDYVENWRAALDVGICGWVVRHNEAQLVNDMPGDPRVAVVPGTEAEPQASIIVPLTVGTTVIGVLALDRMGGRTFGQHELEPARLFANLAAIAIQNARQYDDVKRVHANNLRTLCTALNAKDYYTLGHTARVAAYLVLLCRELGWPEEAIHTIGEAAYLHDIGKIAISDRILTKAGKLNDREWQLMRQHPVLSAEIVRPLYDDDVVAGVRHHHERYDGRGYPDGLAGQDIPAIARAMCVVDSYDAMSFERPYHSGLKYSQCKAELEKCKGSQFDPEMADAFLRVLEKLAAIRARDIEMGEQAAAQIDGDEHVELVETVAEDGPAYRRIADVLRAVRDANPGVRYISTMAERGGRFIFVCDAEDDEAQRSHLGDVVVGDEEIAHVLAGERPDICVLSADEFGVWVSAMSPIRRRNGEIVAVVSVDYPANEAAEAGGLYADSTSALTGLLRGASERVTRAEVDATTDTLTGLSNHSYFHECLADALSGVQGSGGELSLLLCDVDRFAAFNSSVGHAKGDDALRGLGQLVERAARRGDLCARVGGDEFALVLADAGGGLASETAEALLAAVRSAGFGDPAAPLTFGIGVATVPWDALDKDTLLDKAGWAARLAKFRGGDCVVQFTERPEKRYTSGRDQAVRYLSLMAELADAKMLYGEKHSMAVARLSMALAVDLGLSETDAADTADAARLRDIGQFAIPDEVLGKPGRLSDDEWQLVCEHPRAGEDLLRRMDGLDAVADAVAHHHERFDGTGYPGQLSGEDIPLTARIVAVAAAFQALVNRRPYRLERSQEDALDEMRRCAGSQFDPAVVSALERVLSHAEGVARVSPAAGPALSV